MCIQSSMTSIRLHHRNKAWNKLKACFSALKKQQAIVNPVKTTVETKNDMIYKPNARISDATPTISTPNLSLKYIQLSNHLISNNFNKPIQNGNRSGVNSGLFTSSKLPFVQHKSEVIDTTNTTTLSRSCGNLLSNKNSKVTSAVKNMLTPTNEIYNHRDV